MSIELIQASAHDTGLPDQSVQCIVTSPPYWGLRKYAGEQGIDWPEVSYSPMPGLPELYIEPMTCELGLEPTPEMYIGHMVLVMREMWRVLRDDGTLWCNMGDGFQDKQLCGMPWRLAFALQADGWYLRSAITWCKGSPMPESVTDRPTKATEQVFMLTKNQRYYYDAEAVRTTHNLWDWWLINPQPTGSWGESVHRDHVSLDDASDDTMCKVSQDCPVHADLFDWDATDQYDVRVGDLFARSLGIYDHHDPEQPGDSVLSDQQIEPQTAGESSDFPHQPYAPSAIDHNKQTSKMDPVPETSSPYTLFAQTDIHIDGRQGELLLFGQDHDSDGNNTSAGDFDDDHTNQSLFRIPGKRKFSGLFSAASWPPSCTCELYHERTEDANHFATFPEKLVEPCIRAGTSQRGCCPECQAPYERVTESELYSSTYGDSRRPDKPGSNDQKGGAKEGMYFAERMRKVTTTTGWLPTCTCFGEFAGSAIPQPCTVLDPFAGSLTTGVVALRLGRAFIGVDVSEMYLNDIGRQRMNKGLQIEMPF